MRTRLCFFFIGVVLCLGAGLGRAQIERPIFLDKEGKALPIQDDEDLVSFLKTARVTASEDLPVGITKPIRLALSQGDVEARAVFHSIIKSETGIRRMPSGRARGYRRDSYTSQVAAYEIGLMLQIHNIPPTAKRIFDGLDGSVQLWIENAMTEQQRQEQGIRAAELASVESALCRHEGVRQSHQQHRSQYGQYAYRLARTSLADRSHAELWPGQDDSPSRGHHSLLQPALRSPPEPG